jgi:hypothetical protein
MAADLTGGFAVLGVLVAAELGEQLAEIFGARDAASVMEQLLELPARRRAPVKALDAHGVLDRGRGAQ